MNTLILDTNAYSAFGRGDRDAIKLISAMDLIWMPAMVLGELRSGFAMGKQSVVNELALQSFLSSTRVSVASITAVTSLHYANIYQTLKKKGSPIPSNDLWIAACCRELNEPLYSFDAHFGAVEGVTQVGSSADWVALQSK